MKSCFYCGTEAADDAVECASCRRQFSSAGGDAATTQQLEPSVRHRPDGSFLLGSGAFCLVCAVFAIVIAMNQDSSSYYEAARAASRMWTLTLIGGGLFHLGLILSLAGIVVRAIWFLPGNETKPISEGEPKFTMEPRVGSPVGAPGDDGAVV